MEEFELIFDEENTQGVYGISLVSTPANDVEYIYYSKEKPIQFKLASEEKRIVVSAVLIPEQRIYRNQIGDEKKAGYAFMTAETIAKLQQNFFKQNYNHNSSIEHKQEIKDVYFFESWIVENPEMDKSKHLGFNVRKGTWMVAMKIENDEVWNQFIKTGYVTGLSIDAMLRPKQVENDKIIKFNTESEINIFGYNTRFFHMCQGAINTFNHLMQMNPNEEVIGMIRSAALQADKVFEIESEVIDNNLATKEQLDEATLLVGDFKDLMKEIDRDLGMEHPVDYMDGHLTTIEKYLPKELISNSEDSYTDYPQEAVENAKIALRYAEENGWGTCGTPVGKARANQLANSEPVSRDTIARMASFERQRQNSDKELGDGCGRLMWLAWGGDAGVEWASRKLKEIDREKIEQAEIGPRGGIRRSDKAPASDTKNPNPKGVGTAKGDASSSRGAEVPKAIEESLQKKSDEFNEKHKEKLGYGVTIGQLKSVYQRGVGAFNTSRSPKVTSQQQWAQARVNAYLYLVKNGRPQNPKYTTDYDLLPAKHPKSNKNNNQVKFKKMNKTKINSMVLRAIERVRMSSQEYKLSETVSVYASELEVGEIITNEEGEALANYEIEIEQEVYVTDDMGVITEIMPVEEAKEEEEAAETVEAKEEDKVKMSKRKIKMSENDEDKMKMAEHDEEDKMKMEEHDVEKTEVEGEVLESEELDADVLISTIAELEAKIVLLEEQNAKLKADVVLKENEVVALSKQKPASAGIVDRPALNVSFNKNETTLEVLSRITKRKQ